MEAVEPAVMDKTEFENRKNINFYSFLALQNSNATNQIPNFSAEFPFLCYNLSIKMIWVGIVQYFWKKMSSII